MTEQEALQRMVPPGQRRPGKWLGGVIQIWVTRACDKACFACTQGSNLGGRPGMITVEQFEQACISLKDYFGVVGMFGGNPATHPQFAQLCEVMRKHIPRERRGLWCNNPMTLDRAQTMRATFNPAVSNLNVHLDQKAYDLFRKGWPECHPFGLLEDSRHSPVHGAMKDLDYLPGKIPNTEEDRWDFISKCDINQHWSAMIGVFRGELRAWFCEVAGAQAMLHQDGPDYPDTGLQIVCGLCNKVRVGTDPDDGPCAACMDDTGPWWSYGMQTFSEQVRKHCHECLVPLRGYGELAQGVNGTEQTTVTHQSIFKPKTKGRSVELVTIPEQLLPGKISKTIDYVGNAKR